MGKKGQSNPCTEQFTVRTYDDYLRPRSHRFGLLSSGIARMIQHVQYMLEDKPLSRAIRLPASRNRGHSMDVIQPLSRLRMAQPGMLTF